MLLLGCMLRAWWFGSAGEGTLTDLSWACTKLLVCILLDAYAQVADGCAAQS